MSEAADEIARDCLAVRLRVLHRLVMRIYDDALRPVGLRVGQLNMLVAISKGMRRATGLASRLAMDTSTLSRDLDVLKRAGWVRVEPGADKRSRELELTPAGHELLRAALPAWRAAQSQAAELLGERVQILG